MKKLFAARDCSYNLYRQKTVLTSQTLKNYLHPFFMIQSILNAKQKNKTQLYINYGC